MHLSDGRLLARSGAVTLLKDTITEPGPQDTIDTLEPGRMPGSLFWNDFTAAYGPAAMWSLQHAGNFRVATLFVPIWKPLTPCPALLAKVEYKNPFQ